MASDAGSTQPAALAAATPQWSRAKGALLVVSGLLFAVVVTLRVGVFLSGPEGVLPAWVPGLTWAQTLKTVDRDQIAVGAWAWRELHFCEDTLFAGSVGLDAVVDMVGAIAFSVILTVLAGMVAIQEVSRRTYVWRGAWVSLAALVLVYTYHWCGIAPLEAWQSRGNAWTHLAGRTFDAEELAQIRADAARAPSYYAEGEANYIVGQKYKDVPPEETPDVFAKQKEVRARKQEILAAMEPAERERLVEEEYARLVDKKRGGYWPPEVAPARLYVYGSALLETIAIAIWASVLAVLCAIPLAVLAARNTLAILAQGDGPGHRALRWFGVFVVRRFLDACRGFNELVMALIFVSVIGLGPFAGILALWIHTAGILGKVFSEGIEAIDPGQVEALVGSGAGSVQTISFSVLPQVMPQVISYSLLRFESNVRSAAILGWVGAGGIGFLLQDKMVGYNHREVCTMMIMIIMAVSLIDFACGKLRRRFI